MLDKEETLRVLRMLREGRLTQEQAENLLDALEAIPDAEAAPSPAPRSEARRPPFTGNLLRRLIVEPSLTGLRDRLRHVRDEPADWSDTDARGLERATREETLTLDLHEGDDLQITTIWGSLEVEGADHPSLLARVTAFGPTPSEAEELLQAVTIEIAGGDGSRTVRPRIPAGMEKRVRVDLYAYIPPDCDLTASTVLGSLRAHDLQGDLELSTKNGRIEAHDCSGDLEATAVNGSINLSDCAGDVQASAVNGHLELQDCQQDAHASTVNGSVKVKDCGGDLELSSVNGHIEASDCGSDLEASTVNGRIEIADCGGDVEASTTNGPIRIKDCGGDIEASSVNGALAVQGSAWASLEARTVHGEIEIRLESQAASPIDASTEHGHIELRFPEDAGADLDADAGTGAVRCDHPITPSHSSPHALVGALGQGGNSVHLRSRKGDITIRQGG